MLVRDAWVVGYAQFDSVMVVVLTSDIPHPLSRPVLLNLDLSWCFFRSVGCRRAGQDPTALEALLPKHAGTNFRGGLERQGPCGRRAG